MQRLDKALKKWGVPKVCSQRIYSFLCVQKGKVFCYDFEKNSCANLSLAYHANKNVYYVNRSSEKWVWLLEYDVQKGMDLSHNKYIKKKILWEGQAPYVMFHGEWTSYPDKKYYLNHDRQCFPELGVLPKDLG